MFDFIKNMWIMRNYSTDQVQKCVTKNYISQDQANTVLSTQQVTIETQ